MSQAVTLVPLCKTCTFAVILAWSREKKQLMNDKRRRTNYLTTHTHTHTFNDPLSGTTQVSRHQKGKTNLVFTEARDSEWQWHQLGHMQVYTSLQADNHASNPH